MNKSEDSQALTTMRMHKFMYSRTKRTFGIILIKHTKTEKQHTHQSASHPSTTRNERLKYTPTGLV